MAGGERVVIIGAGQGGVQAAFALRDEGWQGAITVLGDEPEAPYQRPPLSKGYLLGKVDTDRVRLRAQNAYDTAQIDVIEGVSVVDIDRTGQTVGVSGGDRTPYDHLILATGASPRTLRLPGMDLPGVGVFRTRAHADALRQRLRPGVRLVVIGAGYIGLELAAAARELGADALVLERAPRVLARVAGPVIADHFQALHRAHGVEVRCNVDVLAFEGDEHVNRVRTADAVHPCDAVIVGVGVEPNTHLAQAAGLACDDGVVVDHDARTSDPAIFAIGDCARRPLVHYADETMRLESVHNALEQGKLAAAAICGADRPAVETPWFWSDQFDRKLQTAGVLRGFDAETVRGDPASDRFAVFYTRSGRLLAVDAVNSPADFLGAKPFITAQASIPAETLADPAQSLRQLASAMVG